MTCACCGRLATPAQCVPTKPKEHRVLCAWCAKRWKDSPAMRLCAQAAGLRRWDVVGEQFNDWVDVEAGRAA
jgi:hypothetical protein